MDKDFIIFLFWLGSIGIFPTFSSVEGTQGFLSLLNFSMGSEMEIVFLKNKQANYFFLAF